MEQTYLSFKNKTEYLFKPGSVQHIYPLGSLVFGLLDTDFRVHLADARALLERFRDLDLSEEQTFSERLANPHTCVYYQVASFYAAMSQAVLRQSPVLFDLLEDFCLSS